MQTFISRCGCEMAGIKSPFFYLSDFTVNDNFKDGKYANSWLPGDSGYPLKRWLMTLITQPATSAQFQRRAPKNSLFD